MSRDSPDAGTRVRIPIRCPGACRAHLLARVSAVREQPRPPLPTRLAPARPAPAVHPKDHLHALRGSLLAGVLHPPGRLAAPRFAEFGYVYYTRCVALSPEREGAVHIFDHQCPMCGNSKVRLSHRGWLRFVLAAVHVHRLTCLYCRTRFWRLCLIPPAA